MEDRIDTTFLETFKPKFKTLASRSPSKVAISNQSITAQVAAKHKLPDTVRSKPPSNQPSFYENNKNQSAETVASWTPAQVSAWLTYRNIVPLETATLLQMADISGDLFLRLTNDDLKEMGVESVGKRMKIIDAIAILKRTEDRRDTSDEEPAQVEPANIITPSIPVNNYPNSPFVVSPTLNSAPPTLPSTANFMIPMSSPMTQEPPQPTNIKSSFDNLSGKITKDARKLLKTLSKNPHESKEFTDRPPSAQRPTSTVTRASSQVLFDQVLKEREDKVKALEEKLIHLEQTILSAGSAPKPNDDGWNQMNSKPKASPALQNRPKSTESSKSSSMTNQNDKMKKKVSFVSDQSTLHMFQQPQIVMAPGILTSQHTVANTTFRKGQLFFIMTRTGRDCQVSPIIQVLYPNGWQGKPEYVWDGNYQYTLPISLIDLQSSTDLPEDHM